MQQRNYLKCKKIFKLKKRNKIKNMRTIEIKRGTMMITMRNMIGVGTRKREEVGVVEEEEAAKKEETLNMINIRKRNIKKFKS